MSAITPTDMQHFTNAAGLRSWLNKFTDAELQVMGFLGPDFGHADRLIVHTVESTLSDGSTVTDMTLNAA